MKTRIAAGPFRSSFAASILLWPTRHRRAFPYGQIGLSISQASYLGSQAVNLRLNSRMYEVRRWWSLSECGWLRFCANRGMLQSFESGHFRVVLLNRIMALHGLRDVSRDLLGYLGADGRVLSSFVIAWTRQS